MDAPEQAPTPTFENAEQMQSMSAFDASEQDLDAPITNEEAFRSATELDGDTSPDTEDVLDQAITHDEQLALDNAEGLRETSSPGSAEHEIDHPGRDDVEFEKTSIGDDSIPQQISDSKNSVSHPSPQTSPCRGTCIMDTMHDSTMIRGAVARLHYPGKFIDLMQEFASSFQTTESAAEEAASDGGGSGAGSGGSNGVSSECCPCAGSSDSSSSSAGSGTGSAAADLGERLGIGSGAAGSGAAAGSGGGARAGGCCPCDKQKKVMMVLNMDKPKTPAELLKFQNELKTELAAGLKIDSSRLTVAAPTLRLRDLGETLHSQNSKTEIAVTIAPGGSQNTTEVVGTLASKLSNPTSTLAKGTLMSNMIKASGLTVETLLPKSSCDAASSKWNYMDAPDAAGPANWKTKYPKCGIEGVQSPIRLPIATPKTAETVFRRLDFDYKSVKLNLINDARNLMFMVQPGSTFRVSGQDDSESQLQYVVFHSPSEHVFTDANGNDIRYAGELQLHHRNAKTGRLVVVAVLLKVNAANPFIEKLFKKIPEKCKSADLDSNLKFEDILPFSRTYYMYYGGLTSPPCTDSVTWYVLREQSTISLEQLERIRKTLKLDIAKPPKDLTKTPGTTLGSHSIPIIDKDKFPNYEYSQTLMGDVRPVQPLGKRKLWTTPTKM